MLFDLLSTSNYAFFSISFIVHANLRFSIELVHHHYKGHTHCKVTLNLKWCVTSFKETAIVDSFLLMAN